MKVLFWTVQKLDVVTVLLQQGFYQPAFAYSDYVGENEKLSDLYGFMLNAYNRVNNTEYPASFSLFLRAARMAMSMISKATKCSATSSGNIPFQSNRCGRISLQKTPSSCASKEKSVTRISC